MGDTGVTQRGSIMNYFQKEKSNDPLKTDKKIDENPIIVELKEDSVDSGDVSHPIIMDKGDQKVMECISSSDNKELDHCVLDQGDYHKDGKCNVRESSDVELEYAGEKCHSERKEKWNFSWKQGKTRKKVKTNAIDTSDSDQDFEMNFKSNGSKSSETEVKDITKSKTQGKKRINRTKASGHCVKPVIEILNPSDPEDGLKSLSDISQNTEAEILFINETNDKGFENESKKKNLDTRGEIEDVDIVKIKDSCKSLKTPKDRLENSKKNYFDVLMQSSKQKTLEKRKTESDTDNHNGDLDCSSSCKEGDRVDDSIKKGEKKGKKNRALRRKKDSIDDKDVGRKVDGENALLQPKKQTRNHSKGCKRDKCSVNETAVRSSTRTRKKFVPTPEVIEDLNQEEAMDIPVVNEVSSKPLTRKRTLSAVKKVFAVEATVVISPDKQVQLEERKQDLLKEQVEEPELFRTSRHGNTESRVEESIDTCDEDKDRKKGRNSKSTKPRRERRLRKSCILDSSDEEEQATESTVEAKPSPVETEDKRPRKVSGPIAPIFLPGAWRRAKSKLEEAEILEADKEIVEVKEDRSLQPIANAINSPVHCTSDIPIDDSSASLNVFLSIFKKPTTKASPVPVQLVEAPFPKISHVQQKDEANDMKWNLPIVWNRFVKEDYFFWPDGSGSFTKRSMSLRFLKTDISCSEEKTKSNPLNALLKLDKSQKQEILSYLKTIYEGIPIKKLFKRSHHQLHTCKKLLMENKNRSIKMNENFKPALTSGSKEPLVSSNVTLPSTNVPGKSVAFTKISKKNRATAQGKTKPETIKKKESPLLLAFQNQENAVKNKNVEVVKTRSKKEKAKTTSIVELMGKQTKQVEDIPTKKQSGKLKKGKKSSGVSNKIENYVDKKRSREGEEQDGKPSGKKAKLVNNAPEFKKPRKGQKRKARSMESKENGNTVETQGSNSDPLGKSPKCRKISSDDDFIKPSTRSSRPKVDTNNDATDDCGTGKQSLRKSRRLQEKKDDLADTRIALVETDDKRAENAVIEVLEVKEDCSKQDGKVQAHENDIKVVEGEPSKVVEATTEPTSEVVEATTKPKSEVVEATTKPKSEVVEATTKPTSEVVEATTKPTSEVVEATTKPTSEVVEATTKNMNEDSDVSSSAVLWSECFKPRNSTEILGNTNAGGKLRNWLFEWKTLREKRLEALKRHKEKKHQKLAAKKGKKETSSWWQDDDDDSDFYSSDDNEDENFDDEDILCNTMLLSGPVGSGKTSSIYACAEELGFKVIEVNSSTKRGGKYILSELLEATQSHQVSTKRGMQTELFPRAAPYEEKKKEQMKGNKKKKGQSKKKEQLSDETQLQGPMSLILLDEVDILFEEDKGFWVSVNTLRQNSKRPIVMTASDLTAIDIDGEYEHIILKSPSLKLYAAYFQTVCLTKDVFVNPSDVRALSWLNHADIRRLLLNLQFWIDSAAGACDKRGITIRNDIGTSAGILSKNDVEYGQANTTQLNAGNAIEMDSTVRTQEECDGKVLSVNANVDNDTASSCSPIEVESRLDKKGSIQNSNDEMLALDKMEKLQSLSKKKIDSTKKFDVINDNKDCERGENDELGKMKKHDTISSQKAPIEMHNLCLESMLGIRNIDNNVGNVFETLKSDLKTKVSFRQKCLVTSHCQSMNMDILYCNLETILPCVFSSINKARDNPLNPKPGDDNGHSFDTENGAESPKDENDVVNDGIEDDASHATVSDEDILSKKLDGISLTCLGNFYEVMSFMDAELYRYEPGTSEEIFGAWSARISPGLSDSAGKHTASQTPWKTTNLQNELRGALEVASLEHSRRKFHNLCSRNGEQMMRYANKLMSQPCTTLSCSSDIKNIDSRISPNCCDEMVADSTNAFSDLDGERCLQVTTLSENLVSKTRKQEQDFSSVSSYLPEMNCLNRRVIVMDYRPALHNICKDESLRKAARIKRRFYHYFDSIGLHIPSSVIQSLTEDSYFS